jgi:hygromycin-B 4-O-kinase
MTPPHPNDELEPVAGRALSKALGAFAERLESVEGGISNQVLQAEVGGRAVVIRLGRDKVERFERERRVIERMRRAGVPTPEVLAMGEQDGYAFMIAERIQGEIAADHPNRLRTLEELGDLAARRIHTIRTYGFGCHYQFEPAAGLDGWRGWLLGEMQADARLRLLRAHDLISETQEAELRDILEAVARWAEPPVLNHGDLRLKNVLVDDEGAILALIDWEHSLSAPGGHWDISIALHDLWADQMQAFLKGYGMTEAEVHANAPTWRLFNALNYAPEVGHALDAGDDEVLERIRIRFSGALDLFGET